MQCPRCGFNNYDGIMVCKNCGCNFNMTQQQNSFNQNYGNHNNYNSGYNSGYNSSYNNGYNNNGYNNNYNNNYNNQQNLYNNQSLQNNITNIDYNKMAEYKDTKGTLKTIGIICGAILMLIILGFGLYTYLDSNDFFEKEITVIPTQVPTPTPTTTPTPTIVETPTPTPQETIVDEYFSQIEDFNSIKLIGSTNTGYMLVPIDYYLNKVSNDTIQYAVNDVEASITIKKYDLDSSLVDLNINLTQSFRNEENGFTNITQTGGNTEDREYYVTTAFYPTNNSTLFCYLFVEKNNPNIAYWISLVYNENTRDDIVKAFNTYTTTLNGSTPANLINESDYFN